MGLRGINSLFYLMLRTEMNIVLLLQVAIQEQLNIREGRPSIFATTESRPPAVVNDHSNQRIYTTPASSDPPVGITGYVGYVFNMIVSLFYNTFSSVINTLLSIFRDDSRRSKLVISSILHLKKNTILYFIF